MWIALYDDTTGRLVSIGTRISDNPDDLRGLGTVTLEGPPDHTLMWDPQLRTFIPRPNKPEIDRMAAALGHPALDKLPPLDRDALRAAIQAIQ